MDHLHFSLGRIITWTTFGCMLVKNAELAAKLHQNLGL